MRTYQAIAEFYDAEYEDNPILQQDVPFLLEHLPKRSQRILELAVGTGRAAIPLAQAGHRVVGVDNDPAMLEIARRKADAVGLDERRLRLARQDALKLNLGERFDRAVMLFNTFLNFTTLDQQDALLSGCASHLRRGGTLWLDMFYPDPEMTGAQHAVELDPKLFYVPALDRTVMRLTELRASRVPQVQDVTFRYRWFGNQGTARRATIRFQMTHLYPRELRLLVERHGFSVVKLYGDYDGTPARTGCSRLIAVCRKG